jgi:zinc protease
VLQQPSFPEAVLEREKARMIASIRDAETKPDQIAARRFAAALYPGHPYGRSASVESVERIGREDLVGFHRTHYAAARATVAIIGDVSRAEAEAIAQRLTDQLPAGGAPATPPSVAQPAGGSVERVAHPASQSHIHLGVPALARGDPDFYALSVGNYILGGGGFVSRLMNEVREKRGFAYSVYSFFGPRKDLGPFEIGLQTRREQAGEALDVVHATLDDFLKNGPTAKELEAAKKNLMDGFALRLDSNRKILDNLAVIGFFGLPLDYLAEYPKNIAKVTREQIREAFARRVSRDRLVTVIVATDAKP